VPAETTEDSLAIKTSPGRTPGAGIYSSAILPFFQFCSNCFIFDAL